MLVVVQIKMYGYLHTCRLALATFDDAVSALLVCLVRKKKCSKDLHLTADRQKALLVASSRYCIAFVVCTFVFQESNGLITLRLRVRIFQAMRLSVLPNCRSYRANYKQNARSFSQSLGNGSTEEAYCFSLGEAEHHGILNT